MKIIKYENSTKCYECVDSTEHPYFKNDNAKNLKYITDGVDNVFLFSMCAKNFKEYKNKPIKILACLVQDLTPKKMLDYSIIFNQNDCASKINLKKAISEATKKISGLILEEFEKTEINDFNDLEINIISPKEIENCCDCEGE